MGKYLGVEWWIKRHGPFMTFGYVWPKCFSRKTMLTSRATSKDDMFAQELRHPWVEVKIWFQLLVKNGATFNNNEHLLRASYIAGMALMALPILTHLIFTKTLWERYREINYLSPCDTTNKWMIVWGSKIGSFVLNSSWFQWLKLDHSEFILGIFPTCAGVGNTVMSPRPCDVNLKPFVVMFSNMCLP